jgi:putative hydrolase of the HAD superfamily
VRLALARDQVHRLLAPIGEELQPIAANVEQVHRLAHLRGQRAGLRLFFLSNMPEPFARSIEQRHDFLRFFDGGVFSGDVKLGKPDPAIYTLLADRHGLDAQRIWFVDDNRANVEAASALGWQALHLPAPEHLPPAIDALLSNFHR